MSIEAYQQARRVVDRLKSSPDFEHAGPNSRGIRVQTDSLLMKMALLGQTLSSQSRDVIREMLKLVIVVSRDFGTYIKAKEGPDRITLEVQGVTGPVNENSTREELLLVEQRRSGIDLMIKPEGEIYVSANTFGLAYSNDETLERAIKIRLARLTDQQRHELGEGLINVIRQEVAESGEFLDL